MRGERRIFVVFFYAGRTEDRLYNTILCLLLLETQKMTQKNDESHSTLVNHDTANCTLTNPFTSHSLVYRIHAKASGLVIEIV